jgi:hypothetical protein
MAGMRMSMRKIREVLRLTHELGLSVRQVPEATGVGKTAVSEYVSRARVVGITWPVPPEISDAELERRLFTPAGFHEGSTKPLKHALRNTLVPVVALTAVQLGNLLGGSVVIETVFTLVGLGYGPDGAGAHTIIPRNLAACQV